jgi:glucokinase-like ROK family protein
MTRVPKSSPKVTKQGLAKNFQTGNQGFLRQQNLSGLMHHLYENAPVSRADLAKLTGLNKTTVSSLINELIKNQFVSEIGAGVPTKIGRRSVLLDINPARGCIVSGEIGVDFISVICTDFAAEIFWKQKIEILDSTKKDEIVKSAIELVQTAVNYGAQHQFPLLGIALGVPGLIDWKSGTVLFAPNLGWANVPLGEIFRQTFQTRITVENEATLAALGEQYFGAAEGYNEVLYVSAGVGLGGGMVISGKPYNGSSGFAGEFGHMTMKAQGELCKCGNRGCWETQVSQAALFRYIEQSIESGSGTVLQELVNRDKDHLTVEAVVDAARSDDRVALDALEKVGRDLGIGIASLVNALNPDLVVFGGILSLASGYLIPHVLDELRNRALHWNEETAKIVTARFGADAAVMGGVARVYQAVLSNPLI